MDIIHPMNSDFLLGLVIGSLAAALIAIGGLEDDVTHRIVTERDAEVAALHRDALITLLNRKPIQVGDDYVICRVTPIQTYTEYVSNYWRSPL